MYITLLNTNINEYQLQNIVFIISSSSIIKSECYFWITILKIVFIIWLSLLLWIRIKIRIWTNVKIYYYHHHHHHVIIIYDYKKKFIIGGKPKNNSEIQLFKIRVWANNSISTFQPRCFSTRPGAAHPSLCLCSGWWRSRWHVRWSPAWRGCCPAGWWGSVCLHSWLWASRH